MSDLDLAEIMAEHQAIQDEDETVCAVCLNVDYEFLPHPCEPYRLAEALAAAERALATSNANLIAEIDRAVALERRVLSKAKAWEVEIDEQTTAKEFGIAEGLRVAAQDVRAALAGEGAADQPQPEEGA